MSADTHSDLQVAQGTDAVRIPNAIKSGFRLQLIYKVVLFLIISHIFVSNVV